MKNNPTKSSVTALRVSKLLLKFLETSMDYKEMFSCIKNEGNSPVYTTEVLNKYLNTLRAIGLDIRKINGKYNLTNFLVEIHLSEDEINAFNLLEEMVLRYGTNKNIINFLEIKKKMIKFFDQTSTMGINHYINANFTTKLGLIIKQFENICDEGQKIKIEYNNKVYKIEPKKVIFVENNVYLEGFNLLDLEIKKFEIEKIKLLEQEPTKNTNIEILNSVIFELSGKLSHIYKLKEGETIIAQSDDKILIKSKNDDYEFLAKKLIRYKDYCKIVEPSYFKKYFINYVEEILKRYN